MDTQSLEAFCAVAQCRSFSQAAEQLYLTQPAVSKRVAGLEHSLGCRLFDRLGRQVQLTEAGELLLPRARQVLQTLGDSRQQIADLAGDVRGQLQLVTSHHVGLHRLPPLLQRYARQYPAVDLQLRFMDSEQAYQEIAQGQHHLALITLASQASDGVVEQLWWNDELVFVCAADHPLAQHPTLSPAELVQHRAILPELSSQTSQIILARLQQAGARPEVALTAKAFDAVKMMVSIGLGWSVLPKTLLSPDLRQLQPFAEREQNQLSRRLGCIYHPDRALSNAARAFLALGTSAADSVPC